MGLLARIFSKPRLTSQCLGVAKTLNFWTLRRHLLLPKSFPEELYIHAETSLCLSVVEISRMRKLNRFCCTFWFCSRSRLFVNLLVCHLSVHYFHVRSAAALEDCKLFIFHCVFCLQRWSMNPCFTQTSESVGQIRRAAFRFSLFCLRLKCFEGTFLCAYIYVLFLFSHFIYFLLAYFWSCETKDERRMQLQDKRRPDRVPIFDIFLVTPDPCSDTWTNAVFYCTVAPSDGWTDVLDSGRAGDGFLPIYLIYDLECSFHGDLWTRCDSF